MKKITKKELKDIYTEWNREISSLNDVYSNNLKDLQSLCKKHNFPQYCSVLRCVQDLASTDDYFIAFSLCSEIYEVEGKKKALRDLAIRTNNMNI